MKKKGGGVQLRVHKLPLCEKCGIAFGKKELLHAHLCTHKERMYPDRNNRTEQTSRSNGKRQVDGVLQATENAKVLEELTPDDIKKQLQSAIKSFRRMTRGESSVGQSDDMTAESCAPIAGARASDPREDLREQSRVQVADESCALNSGCDVVDEDYTGGNMVAYCQETGRISHNALEV